MSHLPPLSALRAFEAAVRLGGFARAAELNVSTSAVSHQIRALEESLGARLLERSTSRRHQSHAGRRTPAAGCDALSRLTDACAEIRGTAQRLTVSANAPFSAMWLARRLAEFRRFIPTRRCMPSCSTTNRISRAAASIWRSHVPAHRLQADDDILLQETVFPVCSPDLHPYASVNVCRSRLLQEMHEHSPEIDWRNWSTEFGLPGDFETKIVRYSSFSSSARRSAARASRSARAADRPRAAQRAPVPLRPGLERAASWRFVLRRNPSTRHRLLDPLIAFLRREAEADAEAEAAPIAPDRCARIQRQPRARHGRATGK